jgi:hypothetical protein
MTLCRRHEQIPFNARNLFVLHMAAGFNVAKHENAIS